MNGQPSPVAPNMSPAAPAASVRHDHTDQEQEVIMPTGQTSDNEGSTLGQKLNAIAKFPLQMVVVVMSYVACGLVIVALSWFVVYALKTWGLWPW